MHKKIRWASVGSEGGAMHFAFSPGINILCGEDAEATVLSLAHFFGGQPSQNIKAEIRWHTDKVLLVSAVGGGCIVERVGQNCVDAAKLVRDFHKQRFLRFRNAEHILDGSDIPDGFSGASDLLLKKLREAIEKQDDRPLFICNFLERLDEAVDLQPIFEALNATGRQVFIAVPNHNMEVQKYGTSIHCESNFRQYL